MNLNDLKQPIAYKWKIQTVSKTKPTAQCVAYIDARDVMDLLDKVCGPENWQDKYEFVGDKLIAGIGIKCGDEWIWKYDTGTAGDIEGEKSIFSDAFKRSAVKWGVGRFLYDLDFKWITTDKPGAGAVPVDESGQRIWDLTKYFLTSNVSPNATKSTNTDEVVREPISQQSSGLEVFCAVCKTKMVNKSGVNAKGEAWSGWFCPKDKTHAPRWI